RVQRFAIPQQLARGAPVRARAVARPTTGNTWAWVGLRGVLMPDRWRVRETASRHEMTAASRDGRRKLRLRLGSRYASVDGARVLLPAAPRRYRGQLQVPSTILRLLAERAS